MALIAALQMASGPQVQANLMEAGRLIKEAAERGAALSHRLGRVFRQIQPSFSFKVLLQ